MSQDQRDYALEWMVRIPTSVATTTSSMAGPGIVVTGVHLPGTTWADRAEKANFLVGDGDAGAERALDTSSKPLSGSGLRFLASENAHSWVPVYRNESPGGGVGEAVGWSARPWAPEVRMESPLKREFEYYLAHQRKLVELYDGRFVVVKNAAVIGVYDDQATAVFETSKTEELGTFLVQKVAPGDSAYTQTFHSRVAFAS